jgi:hypothetical protein
MKTRTKMQADVRHALWVSERARRATRFGFSGPNPNVRRRTRVEALADLSAVWEARDVESRASARVQEPQDDQPTEVAR